MKAPLTLFAVDLAEQDRLSPLGQALLATLYKELAYLREMNDSLTNDIISTSGIRGRIKEVKLLLAVFEERKAKGQPKQSESAPLSVRW